MKFKFLEKLRKEKSPLATFDGRFEGLNDIISLRLIITIIILSFGLLIALTALVPTLVVVFAEFLYKKFLKKKIDRVKLEQVNTVIDRHQRTLLSEDPFYTIKPYSHNYVENLEEFITSFIKTYRRYSNTYNFDGQVFICGIDRRRSLGDIFLICRCYYPTCDMKDVLKILVKLVNNRTIYGSYCNQIHKFVFHRDSDVIRIQDPLEYARDTNLTFGDIIEVYS